MNSTLLPDYCDIGEGRPVILLPGMEGAKEFWKHQSDALSPYYRVVACGYPRRAPKWEHRVVDYAADILRLLDKLKIDQACIIGESFGGMISQEIALSRPDLLQALILCNTFAKPSLACFGLNRFTLGSIVYHLAFIAPTDARISILNWVGRQRGFVMDPSPGNAELAKYVLTYGMQPGLGGFIDRITAGLKENYLPRLSSIKVPTLILRGSEDRVVTEAHLRQIESTIPNAEFVLIEGGGHCCQYSMPDETNQVLLDWLKRNY